MYVAEFSIEGRHWAQAVAVLVYPSPDNETSGSWWTRFRGMIGTIDNIPGAAAALQLESNDRFDAALLITTPIEALADLRRAAGGLTQLGTIADGEVRFAGDRAEHDRILEFPRYRCRVAQPPMMAGDAWFAFDFRVHEFIDELFTRAHSLGYAISYHVNVEPVKPNAQWLRDAARNALRVENLPGVPKELEALQRALADQVENTTHLCEEIVGVNSPDACLWLQSELQQRFRSKFGRHVSAEFEFFADAYDESIIVARHRAFYEPLGAADIAGGAMTAQERLAVLTMEPGADALARMPRRAADLVDDDATAIDAAGMPVPYDGPEPYAFVSYRRADLQRLRPLVTALGQRGWRFWYDAGIPGGAEWHEVAEERLQNCAALLLFLSDGAVRSKWVRREAKFADTLNKPIISVRLDDNLQLAGGLDLLLSQYQMLDSAAPAVIDQLEYALRSSRVHPNPHRAT